MIDTDMLESNMLESNSTESKISVDPASQTAMASYKLLIGSIVPRPIAFVSTISPEGVANLAPFSFFNAICADPPSICFSVGNRTPAKDTIANIRANGEFVVNIVNEAIAEQMNLCAGDYPAGVSEFSISGLTPEASEIVKPPCVRESPMNMECKLIQIVEVSARPSGGSLIIGEVVRFHFDRAIAEDFRIDPAKLRAVGRMSGNQYIRTRDRFEMIRPAVITRA
jgi:flavin reductase (DIM6/NTAB) family NADH-FMN oxidoreductase RutF